MAVSICKAGAGGSLAQDRRGVRGELVFSNRGISGKGKFDTEWDREKQTGFHPRRWEEWGRSLEGELRVASCREEEHFCGV